LHSFKHFARSRTKIAIERDETPQRQLSECRPNGLEGEGPRLQVQERGQVGQGKHEILAFLRELTKSQKEKMQVRCGDDCLAEETNHVLPPDALDRKSDE